MVQHRFTDMREDAKLSNASADSASKIVDNPIV
jgi:hypothetical protein